MLSRFELLLVVRNQLGDRALVQRYRCVAAVLEALAPTCGEDAETWALVGLGGGLDVRLCDRNPERLGEVAAELLATEGAPQAVARAVREARQGEPESLPAVAAGLVVAEALVTAVETILEEDPEREPRDLQPFEVCGALASRRALSCAAGLPVGLEELAALCLDAVRRVREEGTR